MTNFEKIKNMSIDELAAKCCEGLTCAFCPIASFCDRIIGEDVRLVNCVKVWETWLKSEVQNNDISKS